MQRLAAPFERYSSQFKNEFPVLRTKLFIPVGRFARKNEYRVDILWETGQKVTKIINMDKIHPTFIFDNNYFDKNAKYEPLIFYKKIIFCTKLYKNRFGFQTLE